MTVGQILIEAEKLNDEELDNLSKAIYNMKRDREDTRKEEIHEYYQVCISSDDPIRKSDYRLPYHFETYQKARVFISEKNLFGKAYIIIARD